MINVNEELKFQERLESDRGVFESHWQEIADNMHPRSSGAFLTKRTAGDKRRELIFDNTGEKALITFAAGLHDTMTSEGRRWFLLRPAKRATKPSHDEKTWLEMATMALEAVYNSPGSNFHPSAQEFYTDLGGFGSGCMYVGDRPGNIPRFQAFSLGQVYVVLDDEGAVAQLRRKFPYTAYQLERRFGSNPLPQEVRDDLKKNPLKKYTVLHITRPRRDAVQGSMIARNKPFEAVFILIDKKVVLEEGGYDDFPFIFSRWSLAEAGEVYGRGPGMVALPDVKMLQEMERTILSGLQRITDPPVEVPHDGYMKKINLAPGAVNVRRKNLVGGKDGITPIVTHARPDLGEQKAEQKRGVIKDAFYNDVFKLPGPLAPDGDVLHMNSVQAAAYMQERLRMLGPIFSRLKIEYLGPLVYRTLRLLLRNGLLPEPPPSLVRNGLDVEYVSPLAIAQSSGDVGSIMTTMAQLTPLMEIDETISDIFNFQETASIIAERNQYPTRGLRSPDELRQIGQERARQAAEERQNALNQQNAQVMNALANVAP